jgi:hydrogenase maturation protease
MRTRVIGIGTPLGGDAAIGAEVTRWLCASGLAEDVDLHQAAHIADVAVLLRTTGPVVLVGALRESEVPGTTHVFRLDGDDALCPRGTPLHDAMALARAMQPGRASPDVLVVGVEVPVRAHAGGHELSDAMAAALPTVARATLGLAHREAANARMASLLRSHTACDPDRPSSRSPPARHSPS